VPQRQVLSLGVRREARRVSGDESERRVFVATVFGKIEMHAADLIPRRMAVLEKLLQRTLGLRQLGAKRRVEIHP
jgi:hypothetical protein